MVFFAGVAAGTGGFAHAYLERDRSFLEGCMFFCRFDGGRDEKNLDKLRYKVTKAEAAWYYEKFDVDKSGVLERPEVRALLDSIEQIPDPAFAVEGSMGTMAVKQVDEVELDTLIYLTGGAAGTVPAERVGRLLVLHRALSRNRAVVNGAFDLFDHSGDGYLDANELVAFLKQVDPRATTDELASLLDKMFTIDKDNDGKISRAELLASVGYWKEMVGTARAQAWRNQACACCRGTPVGVDAYGAGSAGAPILVIPASVVVAVDQPQEMARS